MYSRPLPSFEALLTLLLLLPLTTSSGAETIHPGGTIAADSTWAEVDSPHVMTGTITIDPGATLTVEAGVTVMVDYSKGLYVRGRLECLGDATYGIAFTRKDTLEAWRGIVFDRYDATGLLQYVTVEHASYHSTSGGGGSAAYVGSADSVIFEHCMIRDNREGIYLTSTAAVRLTDSTIRGNTYGIRSRTGNVDFHDVRVIGNNQGLTFEYVDGLTWMTPVQIDSNSAGLSFLQCRNLSVSNQTISYSTGTGISIGESGVFHIGSGNVLTGNDWGLAIDSGSAPDSSSSENMPLVGNANADAIRVSGGNSTERLSWFDMGVPYVVAGTVGVDPGGALTVREGCEVLLVSGSRFLVGGRLDCLGALDHPVTFRGQTPTSRWRYIRLGAGTLQYTSLEDATYDSYSTAVYAVDGDSVVVDHCTLRQNHSGIRVQNATAFIRDCVVESNSNGIWLQSASPRIENSRITANASYGILADGESRPDFGSIQTSNEIHDNGSGAAKRDVVAGTADFDAPYVYWGTIDEAEIRSLVRDVSDDPLLGEVRICPWTNAARDSLYCLRTTAGPADEDPRLPAGAYLAQNRPNPFNPSTTLRFGMPRAGEAEIRIHDVRGRRVRVLQSGWLPAGSHELRWDGRDERGDAVGSGTYVAELRLDGARTGQRIKLVLMK